MSVQDFAVASQKLTWPTVTGVDPAVTAAVSVNTVPEVVDGLEIVPELTVTVVVVEALVCAAASCKCPPTMAWRTNKAASHARFPCERFRIAG
jgi:hypothetical protein